MTLKQVKEYAVGTIYLVTTICISYSIYCFIESLGPWGKFVFTLLSLGICILFFGFITWAFSAAIENKFGYFDRHFYKEPEQLPAPKKLLP